MNDQTKQKIEAWVEANLTAIHKTLNSGLARANCPKKKHDGVCCKMTFVGTLWGLCCPPQDPLGAALRRAIIFGLELGKEAVKDTKSSGCGNPRKCGSACGQCRFHAGFGTGRTKGQRAIQEIIDSIRI